MDNATVNASLEDNLAARIGIAAANGVLLLILFIITVLNLLVVAALFVVNSELVRSIRVILINILVACVIGELGSATYHISALLLLSESSISRQPRPLCYAITFLDVTSSSGRVLFAVYYALTVFIVARWWNKPVLAPRNTKYFIIGAVFVWFLAIVAVVPAIIYVEFTTFCEGSSNNSQDTDFLLTLYVSLPYFFLSAIPVIVTPIILIIVSCYIKHNSIGEHRDTKKALVKFGFFLLVIQGVNAIAQIVAPLLLVIGISSLSDTFLATFIAVAVSDLSRIPTNLLIITFFKPVQDKLKKWICGCNCCPCFRHIIQIAGNYIAENGDSIAHACTGNQLHGQ